MHDRKIAGQSLAPVGLGCMNLSHAYGEPLSESEGTRVLHAALDAGITHFDTAALYGFGKNEILLGKALKAHRNKIFLASKCGMAGVDGKRVIDGRPSTIRATVEQSLTSLQTDVLDLCYLHRWDKNVPIEESVGELSRLLEEGKIKSIGLSEVSANTLHKAHKTHPIAAIQTEYSLWTRNAEIAILDACQELDVAFVAFSPLARGFLGGFIANPEEMVNGDIRKGMPRFQSENMEKNRLLLNILQDVSDSLNCTPSQLALAWVLQKNDNILAIPGTTNVKHLLENLDSIKVSINDDYMSQLDDAFEHSNISGARYPVATQTEIDTEEFV